MRPVWGYAECFLVSIKASLEHINNGNLFVHHKGLVMLVDIAEERGGAAIFDKWNNPRLCHFPLFPGISAMDPTRMGLVYAIMWIGIYFFAKYLPIYSIFVNIFYLNRCIWNICWLQIPNYINYV